MVSVLAISQSRCLYETALGESAHTFYRYFRALGEESLNPVERFVFSLMLAKAKSQPRASATDRSGA
jgi:hypothetical protein